LSRARKPSISTENDKARHPSARLLFKARQEKAFAEINASLLKQKGTIMFTKNKTGYMAQVDAWLQKEVFPPITRANAEGDAASLEAAYSEASKLIKNKMLESYKNGIAAADKAKAHTR
jgi:hypothetical protein